MTVDDFLGSRFLELPWSVVDTICLYLPASEVFALTEVPKLRGYILNHLSRQRIEIYPSVNEVIGWWNLGKVALTSFQTSIERFLDDYPELSPRVWSVCVEGDFLKDVSPVLYNRLYRAERIEIWALEQWTYFPSKQFTTNDFTLMLSFPGVCSVDLHRRILNEHGDLLATILPQVSELQLLRLEIENNVELTCISNLQHLTSLELTYQMGEDDDEDDEDEDKDEDDDEDDDEGDDEDENKFMAPVETSHELLSKVFQSYETPQNDSCLLKFPPFLKTLKLSHFGICTVNVSLLPPTLESLDLSFNEIDSFVYEGSTSMWPANLKTIVLQSNEIGDSSLGQLLHIEWPPFLETLDFLDNNFTTLESLRNLPSSLKHLKLSSTLLHTLEVSYNPDGYPFFKFPICLLTLSLERCWRLSYATAASAGFTDVHNRICFPPNLEKLSIEGGTVETLASFIFPSSLKSLELKSVGIRELTSYNISSQRIEVVSWAQLVNLRHLNLNLNKITTLANWRPPKLLRILDVSDNKITSLESQLTPLFSKEFSDWTQNIVSLDFRANHISTLGRSLFLPKNLRELNFSSNSLSRFVFTESFASHENLFELNLSLNPIERISIFNSTKRFSSSLQLLYLVGTVNGMSADEFYAMCDQLGLKLMEKDGIVARDHVFG